MNISNSICLPNLNNSYVYRTVNYLSNLNIGTFNLNPRITDKVKRVSAVVFFATFIAAPFPVVRSWWDPLAKSFMAEWINVGALIAGLGFFFPKEAIKACHCEISLRIGNIFSRKVLPLIGEQYYNFDFVESLSANSRLVGKIAQSVYQFFIFPSRFYHYFYDNVTKYFFDSSIYKEPIDLCSDQGCLRYALALQYRIRESVLFAPILEEIFFKVIVFQTSRFLTQQALNKIESLSRGSRLFQTIRLEREETNNQTVIRVGSLNFTAHKIAMIYTLIAFAAAHQQYPFFKKVSVFLWAYLLTYSVDNHLAPMIIAHAKYNLLEKAYE